MFDGFETGFKKWLEPDNRWVQTYMKGLSVNAKIAITEMRITF